MIVLLLLLIVIMGFFCKRRWRKVKPETNEHGMRGNNIKKIKTRVRLL